MSQKACMMMLFLVILVSGCVGTRSTVERKPKTHADLVTILQPGEKVRVETPDTGLIEGKVGRVATDSVVLRESGRARNISIDDITGFWTRPSHVAKGAVFGALGFGLMGTLWGGMSEFFCEFQEVNTNGVPVDCPDHFEYGIAIGVIGGAILGGVWGALKTDWQQVYP